MYKKYQKTINLLLLLIILIIGFCLRANNLNQVKNVDEANIIKRAVLFADGQWHIKWYNWPAQSLIRINGVSFKIITSVNNVFQQQNLTTAESYRQNKNLFDTGSRYLTILFALGSIIMLYFLGKKILSSSAGLLAAFFLSINYLHTLHSHFTTPDVPVTFCLLLSILLALNISRSKIIIYILAGANLGFAFATKYTGALAIVPILLVIFFNHCQKNNWQFLKILKTSYLIFNLKLLFFLLSALIIHTIFNPFFFNDLNLVYKSLFFETGSAKMGVDWAGQHDYFFLNIQYYLKSLLNWNGTFITIIAYIALLISLIKIKKKNSKDIFGISIFFIIILVTLSSVRLHWSRWAVPLLPLICLIAAFGLINFCNYLKNKINYKKILLLFYILFILIISLPSFFLSYVGGLSFQTKSTSEKMAEYIEQNIPENSYIISDTIFLDINKTKYQFEEKGEGSDLYKKSIAQYTNEGVDYLIIKPERFYFANQQPDIYQNIISFHNVLGQSAQEVITIKNNDGILKQKKDWQVYHWLWHNSLKDLNDISKGTALILYKL